MSDEPVVPASNEMPNRIRTSSPEDAFDLLEEKYKERLPKNWEEFNMVQKLDWFAHRMLLDEREVIREEQGNDAVREWGFMSDYQLERRRRREVHSKLDSWDDVPPRRGVFRRVYVDKNNLLTGRKDDDGPKNPTV